MYFALTLTVDFNNAASGQVEDPGTNSRQWFTSPDNVNWTPFGSSDGPNHPVLHFPRGNPANADSLSIRVFYLNPPTNVAITCNIIATFTGQRRRQVDVSSPFRRPDGSVVANLGLESSADPVPPNAFVIGPFPINLDPSRLRPNRPQQLPFEFSVVTRFNLLSTNSISFVDFCYDPEMEVSIDN
jgi:hypothetical protein